MIREHSHEFGGSSFYIIKNAIAIDDECDNDFPNKEAAARWLQDNNRIGDGNDYLIVELKEHKTYYKVVP